MMDNQDNRDKEVYQAIVDCMTFAEEYHMEYLQENLEYKTRKQKEKEDRINALRFMNKAGTIDFYGSYVDLDKEIISWKHISKFTKKYRDEGFILGKIKSNKFFPRNTNNTKSILEYERYVANKHGTYLCFRTDLNFYQYVDPDTKRNPEVFYQFIRKIQNNKRFNSKLNMFYGYAWSIEVTDEYDGGIPEQLHMHVYWFCESKDVTDILEKNKDKSDKVKRDLIDKYIDSFVDELRKIGGKDILINYRYPGFMDGPCCLVDDKRKRNEIRHWLSYICKLKLNTVNYKRNHPGVQMFGRSEISKEEKLFWLYEAERYIGMSKEEYRKTLLE